MKGISLLSIIIILTVVPSNSWPVFAELKQDSPTPSPIAQRQPNCNNPQTDIEIKECIRLRYEAADTRLNEVYKQLVAKLSREERSLISEAQQGWIELRENNCHFEVYGSRMGTGYRGFLNECRERMTQQRTAELEKYLRER
ncbi:MULTISPECIES: lysozyme inhibitor LprI family protein [unclassified Microcoleus]|uniref:lysozyme inhibitor LprI family protein n=1 Tax=unclassified Microcoleus TaxID=2642155 RepID=UPI0025FA5305|nr:MULTISPECIES: lysozyme inhibitor LprI family protein [unclassified Microcoleus]